MGENDEHPYSIPEHSWGLYGSAQAATCLALAVRKRMVWSSLYYLHTSKDSAVCLGQHFIWRIALIFPHHVLWRAVK